MERRDTPVRGCGVVLSLCLFFLGAGLPQVMFSSHFCWAATRLAGRLDSWDGCGSEFSGKFLASKVSGFLGSCVLGRPVLVGCFGG